MKKSELRKHYLSKRKAISIEEVAIKSQQITDLFFQNFDLSEVKYLHIFLPIIKHNEINTWLIIKYLQQNFPEINIIIPKIITKDNILSSIDSELSSRRRRELFLNLQNQDDSNKMTVTSFVGMTSPHMPSGIQKELENYLFDENNLIENTWGILEPSGENQEKILSKQIDLVIIPLLIFDKEGNRVGYGKGFYDRFLQQCRPETLKIGLCLEEPVETIEDINEYDVKMNFCITPIKIYKF
jgi:5-formyltetrahydrofolate cyclo-ligase